jgi:hypothetical protein
MSIYNNIRSSKVTTGNAGMYQGMRTFDSSAQVCPVRANVSDSGVVGVARDSINAYSAGCFSPLDRMVVENIQRPRYSTYLNAGAINDPGVGDSDMPQADPEYQSRVAYDTQLGYKYVRPVLPQNQINPEYQSKNFKFATAEAMKNKQYQESDYVQCFMDRKYEQRLCSGAGGNPFYNGQ